MLLVLLTFWHRNVHPQPSVHRHGRRLLQSPVYPGAQSCELGPDSSLPDNSYAQKLSCTFTLDVPGLGYLEGGSEPNVG